MDQLRRAQYRVELDQTSDLGVTISGPNGEAIEGRLVDVSASGAGVRFRRDGAPSLTVGQTVDLVFSSPDLAEPLTVPATVQHRTEEDDEGWRRYGFRFMQSQVFQAYLPATLREFFNRRRGMRVGPDPYRPITVTMQAPDADAAVDTRMENLGALGARVSLRAEQDASFADTTIVELVMEIPGARQPLGLVARIRYRRLVGRRIQYGLEFDTKRSADFKKTSSVIGKYVRARLQETLRSQAA